MRCACRFVSCAVNPLGSPGLTAGACRHKAAEPEWHQIFLRGIACNWLVCIAIWQAAGARDTLSKIVAIWIPVMIFVSAGYDHGASPPSLAPHPNADHAQ